MVCRRPVSEWMRRATCPVGCRLRPTSWIIIMGLHLPRVRSTCIIHSLTLSKERHPSLAPIPEYQPQNLKRLISRWTILSLTFEVSLPIQNRILQKFQHPIAIAGNPQAMPKPCSSNSLPSQLVPIYQTTQTINMSVKPLSLNLRSTLSLVGFSYRTRSTKKL